MKAPLSKVRRRIRIACLSLGAALMLIAAATTSGLRLNIGGGVVVCLAQETLRFESQWPAGSWRGHAYRVDYKRRTRPSGAMLELGGGLLAIAGAAIAIAPFCVPRRRFMEGSCQSCGYDRQGLAADAPCPECGAATAAPTAQLT